MVMDACSDTLELRSAILNVVFANADFSGSEHGHGTLMTLVMPRPFDVSMVSDESVPLWPLVSVDTWLVNVCLFAN